MSKEIYISSTPHETRLAIVEKDELSEIYYERENEYTLAGSIYNGRVTRVLPGMQSAFVDVGLERDAFLYITDFLEEQGESADFESGGEGRRNERGGDRGSGERGGSEREGAPKRGDRDRGGRSREQGRETPRETAEETSSAAQPEFAAVDPQEGSFERSQERSSDRSQERSSDRSQERSSDRSQERGSERATERGSEPGEEGSQEGSRTWRGRRGRRRGRGGEGRSAVAEQESAGSAASAAPEPTFAGRIEEAPQPATLDRVEAQGASVGGGRREGGGREERGGRDRGGRGRDRERSGDRDRERSGDRGGRPGPVESTGPELGDAEPLILPGESLSKYRRGEEGEPAEASASLKSKPQTTLLTARPSTEFDLSVKSWDGGSVLPGETLSRHRGRPNEAPAAQEFRSGPAEAPVSAEQQAADEAASGRDRRRERDRKRGHGGDRVEREGTSGEREATPTSFHSGVSARENLHPMDAVQPGVTSQHEPEATNLPTELRALESIEAFNDVPALGMQAFEERDGIAAVGAMETEYVSQTDVASATDGLSEGLLEAVQELHKTVAASAEPSVVHSAVPAAEDFQEETTEYEPGEDASASYRVDPAGPSEFRQSGLVEDELNLAEVRFEAGSEVAQAGSGHQFTAVQPTGEMLSEWPGEGMVPGAEEHPTNPVEHETAVQSVHLNDVQGTAEPHSEPAQASGSESSQGSAVQGTAAQGFAPGDGYLEEELLDDEESDLMELAASYGDDTEEETFEAGAEIGSLARDRALEQLTRAEMTLVDEEEEEDFEIDEEDLEEDELEEDEELSGSDLSEIEEEETAEDEPEELDEEGEKPAAASMGEFPEFTEGGGQREPRRDRGGEARRDSRRGEGRDRGGRGGSSRGGRDSRGMANSRSNGGRPSRHSVQNTDLPAISDLLKPGQEVLVQIAKEPIAKKGARITSHIALPGRFLVFMPTVNHIGVSRKIESDGERRRLKEVLLSEKGEAAGGFIVRTAALGASEEELRSDLRFLLNLWADIKQRSESSKSPALIYHDLNLVERILRDQVTDNFSAIWVDTETEYERVLRFLQRFQPALMRRVKLYTKDTPLFEQFGISEEINKALRSKVWLKSGGSIVINQTEALVAIDINTGKYVGKTARLEDTIVKTNLDAIPEIVRQIRLRDLGGIIVIDFIDMDDRKNRTKVLAALEEELKNDRAPSKVLQFNDFGLVAITRKRVKQSLERTLSTTCAICAGTGMTKSAVTVCNEIYIELRKMHKQLDKGDVMLRVHPEVVKQLKSGNGKWLQEMEEISGKTILIKSDPSLHPEQFDIH